MSSEEKLFIKDEEVPKVEEKPKKKRGRKPLSPNSKRVLIERLKEGKRKKALLKSNKKKEEIKEELIPKEEEKEEEKKEEIKEKIKEVEKELKKENPLKNEEKTFKKSESHPLYKINELDFQELKNELKNLKELLKEKKNLSNNKEETEKKTENVKIKENPEASHNMNKQNVPLIIEKEATKKLKRKVKSFR